MPAGVMYIENLLWNDVKNNRNIIGNLLSNSKVSHLVLVLVRLLR